MKINVTDKHKMLLEVPPEGRYLARVQMIDQTANKKGDGFNALVTFVIDSGDFTGKTLDMYCPLGHDFGIAKLAQIYAAAKGEYPEGEVDIEDCVGESVVIEIGHRLYEGKKQAEIGEVLPAETPTETPFP